MDEEQDTRIVYGQEKQQDIQTRILRKIHGSLNSLNTAVAIIAVLLLVLIWRIW